MVIAVTFQRLAEDALRQWSLEEELVIEALRRSTGALRDASVEQLGSYIRGLSREQLAGVAVNVKGIYHELLFVQSGIYPMDGVDAQLKESINHPGADVEFTTDGNVVGEFQLKAVASKSLVLEHLARYPDIPVLATEEVAATMDGIGSTGLRNEDLKHEVEARLEDLRGDGLLDEINEGLLTSALVSSAVVARQAIKGRTISATQVRSVLVDAGVGITTAVVLETILAPVVS